MILSSVSWDMACFFLVTAWGAIVVFLLKSLILPSTCILYCTCCFPASASLLALGKDQLRLMSDEQIGGFGKTSLWQKLL